MKILIISQYYYPEQFQINEIAPELVRRGHQVTVLCGTPNYPQGVVFEGYEKGQRSRETLDGVEVIRVRQHPRGRDALGLLINYYSFAKNANKEVDIFSRDFDIVVAYQLSPVTSSLPAVRYKNKYGAPLLLYCLDIWPESAKTHLGKLFGWMYSYVRKLSKKVYLNSDRILVSSRPFITYLNRENEVPIERIGYLPQHADSSLLKMDLEAEENGVADFMFAGNIGKGQHLETLVEAAERIGKRSDYKIHIVGDGSRRAAIEALVKEKGLQDNFVFYGNQKRSDMPAFYKKADALLILLRQVNAVGLTMPGKLQTYMTLHKPIFGAINGAAKEVIEEARCGSCVAAQDSVALAATMKHFIEHPCDYKECEEYAEKYFLKHFTLEKYVDALEAEMKKLINNHNETD